MAGAGRKPKPNAIKKLEGNPGKRPINDSVPVTGNIPKCPSFLMKEAKAEGKRILEAGADIGVIDDLDLNSFAAYCQSYARGREAEEDLTKNGLTFETGTGYIQQRPQVAIAMKEKNNMLKFATEFGLTPSARSRISLFEKDSNKKDDMDDLLNDIGA